MPDIFLSYSRDDQAAARRFAEAFAAQGLDVWWDTTLRAGEAYDQVTEKALREAKAVVVLWSKRSVESRWVRAEATLGDRNNTLVPVMIEPCERPIMFELTQTADLAHWDGAPDDRAWLGFLGDVRRFVDPGPAKASAPNARHTQADNVAVPEATLDPTLAVLPFDNLSDDREMLFFSDGVSEDILGRLSRGSKLKVIGRTSSFQFRGADKARAAAALKATHVLDGSIRRAGVKVRIGAHLTETAGQTTLWSERYERSLEDIFAVQDEISEAIAQALSAAFLAPKPARVDPSVYDLYLRASPKSYAPDELRTSVSLLEIVTQRAPGLTEAWGRLAYLRAWLAFYQSYADRGASGARVAVEAGRALAGDPHNVEALVAQFLILPPFGRFIEADALMDRVRGTQRSSDLHMFVGWHCRALGRVRESAEEAERAYQLDALNPLVANMTALGRMAAGRVAEAAPILEDLVARVPDMSFPVANLLRARTLLKDWDGVDNLLKPDANRPLREFEDGLTFIRAKRDPSPRSLAAMRSALDAHVNKTGCIDLSHLVYGAHLGLVEEAYRAAEAARFGPLGTSQDIMGPDAYRTGLLFWAGFPELRADPRFVRLCARLGLVEYWLETQNWPDCVDEVPYNFKAACEDARATPKDAFDI